MKYLITILFLTVSNFLFATNYYVKNSGSDEATGTSDAQAWQTIEKANSVAIAGDYIYLKRGDTWREMVVPVSGVTYSAYGTGERPLITGLQTLTDFTNIEGNIWETTASGSVDSLKMVLINGRVAYKARYPNYNSTNGGYLVYSYAYTFPNTKIITSLSDDTNYVGKEIVIRRNQWLIDALSVSAQEDGTLTVTPQMTVTSVGGGNGFFFQNDSSYVDTVGEYSYNKTTKKLIVYSESEPTVQISTLDTLVWIAGDNIVFDNINFEGGNKYGFKIDTLSNHITIQNCNINYSGEMAVCGQRASYISLISDSIVNSHSNGVLLRSMSYTNPLPDTCNYVDVSYCYFKNTGLYAGMGLSGNDRYNAIDVQGKNMNIYGNKVDSTGYIGIFFVGDSALVKYNLVEHSLLVKDDGGAIYTDIGAYLPENFSRGSRIESNIVLNTMHNAFGLAANKDGMSAGIYVDDFSKNITVEKNGVHNTFGSSYFLHLSDSILVQNNIAYDSSGHCLWISTVDSLTTPEGTRILNNSFFEAAPHPQYIVNLTTGDNVGYFDYNHYLNLLTPNYFSFSTHTLSVWQATGRDLNSTGTAPNTIGKPEFIYNPTFSDSSIFFDSTKKSLDGTIYYHAITLTPFQSVLLFDSDLAEPPKGKMSIGTLKFITE